MTMRVLSLMLVGCGLLVTAALAQTDETPPLPDRNPVRLGMVLPPKPIPPGEEPTVPWTDAEIAAAKTACTELLKTETVDYDVLPPIKEGICGAPVPILVRSIGANPKVAIDPPATTDCPMAKELSDWLEERVQPAAKRLLNTTVVGLHNATSYACRNRYGSATTPLSEHALANALDVSEFVLASGARITVLDNWPKPVAATSADPAPPKDANAKDANAKDANAKDASAKDAGAKGSSVKVADKIKATPAKADADAASSPPKHAIDPTKSDAVKPGQAKPEAADPGQSEPAKPDPKTAFVVEVHDAACQDFGTVLGPAANAAHKNHFHLDMKARKHSAFCQ